MLILRVQRQAQVVHNRLRIHLPLFTLQTPQRNAVTRRRSQPRLITAAGDEHLGLAPAQVFEPLLQLLTLTPRHRRVQPRIRRPTRRLEVVPHNEQRLLAQHAPQGRPLVRFRRRHRIRAEHRLHQPIQHITRRAHFRERQPQHPLRQALRLRQPLQVTPRQRGLAHTAQAMHQQPRRRATARPL